MTLLRGWTHTWTPSGFPSACFASQQPGTSPSHPSELLQQEGRACAGILWQSPGRAHAPHSTTGLAGIQFQGNETLTRPETIPGRPRIHQIKVGWKAALFSPPLLQSPGTNHTETSFCWDPLNQNSPPFFFVTMVTQRFLPHPVCQHQLCMQIDWLSGEPWPCHTVPPQDSGSHFNQASREEKKTPNL